LQSWLTAIFKLITTFWKPGANPGPELQEKGIPLSALKFLPFSNQMYGSVQLNYSNLSRHICLYEVLTF